MQTYVQVLQEFYRGEVSGEAGYSALLGWARNAHEQFAWAALLQLETETKAWLRAPLLAHGVSIEERPADRSDGLADAKPFLDRPWPDQVQSLYDLIATEYVPRYQCHLDAARVRQRADEEEVCRHMLDHEYAQLEFARRELGGASLTESLKPVVALLKYPLEPRSIGSALPVQ